MSFIILTAVMMEADELLEVPVLGRLVKVGGGQDPA
jgi:hypothetical protein